MTRPPDELLPVYQVQPDEAALSVGGGLVY
jgi:hypothetical protein